MNKTADRTLYELESYHKAPPNKSGCAQLPPLKRAGHLRQERWSGWLQLEQTTRGAAFDFERVILPFGLRLDVQEGF